MAKDKKYRRARVSSREWHTLDVIYGWSRRAGRVPPAAHIRSLIAKGYIAEGPPPEPPPYHVTWLGSMFFEGVMLDTYFGKDINESIYPAKSEIAYAVKKEKEYREKMGASSRRFDREMGGPFRREYAKVNISDHPDVTIRVPIGGAYKDLPDAPLDAVSVMERRIDGKKLRPVDEAREKALREPLRDRPLSEKLVARKKYFPPDGGSEVKVTLAGAFGDEKTELVRQLEEKLFDLGKEYFKDDDDDAPEK